MIVPGAIDQAADGLVPPPAPELVRFPAWPKEHRPDPERRRLWLTEARYRFEYERGGMKYALTVPADFLYDGASVPNFLESLISERVLHKAGCLHDLPYRRGGLMLPGEWQWQDSDGAWHDVSRRMTRLEADELFRDALAADPAGPGRFRRWAAFRGVRLARSAWGPKDGPTLGDTSRS